jgi:polyphosphate kinase
LDLFFNREASQLLFNRRVLAQAADPSIPLLERLRFLCIFSSNLDEFFEIRVSDLAEQLRRHDVRAPVRLVEGETYRALLATGQELVAAQYALYNEVLLPALAAEGIALVHHSDRNPEQKAWVRDYFFREVKPLLTPIGLDPSHPFPQIANKSLNFVVELGGTDAFGRATAVSVLRAPRVLPRIIALPPELSAGRRAFVLLSSVIRSHISDIFGGREAVGYSQFRVTRDSDLAVDENEVRNLRHALSGELSHRQFGHAVRLEVGSQCPERLAEFLLREFGLPAEALFRVDGPVNLVRLREMIDRIDRPDLRYPGFVPRRQGGAGWPTDPFTALRNGDVLLHHPFDSFQTVIDFIARAAIDPAVVAIKQTIYRTSNDSALMEALILAAQHGKEVTVVVELKARFDEEANINWAERLEAVGAQVVYGVVGLKTHAKMALVVRREGAALSYYAHLGTGNYHPVTTRQYTDFGLLSANAELCLDVSELFLHLTSMVKLKPMHLLWVAPFTLHKRLLAAITRETQLAKDGKSARIIAKMNALLDESVIKALYAASQAGVKVELIIRGACALRPGVAGLSENIKVRSIVGRFLEHSRIYYFRNDGEQDVWLASADWMGRNLFGRVEAAFPVLDRKLKKRVIDEGLKPYLADNVNAWVLTPDGEYRRLKASRGKRSCAQEVLLAALSERGPEKR